MQRTNRVGFMAEAVAAYLIVALAWIFLSDQVLLMVADRALLVSLSTVKGVFFVIASAAGFALALRAVPPAIDNTPSSVLGVGAGFAPRQLHQSLLSAGFAVLVSLASVVVCRFLPGDSAQHPLMILFMLPVILSALAGGMVPGLLATAVVGVGADITTMPAIHSASSSAVLQLQLALLVINGVAVSYLSELLRRAVVRTQGQQRLLKTIVTGSSDAIFVKDLQGHYVLVNPAAAEQLRRPMEEILQLRDADLFEGEVLREIAADDREVMDQQVSRTREQYLRSVNRAGGIYLVTKGPVLDERGAPFGVFGIARNITSQKALEARLKAGEERLQRVIDGSDQGYWDWNLQTDDFQVSPRFETMLGYAPGELMPKTEDWPNLVHPEDLPVARASIEAHLRGEQPKHEMELRVRTKQGGWCWVLTSERVVAWDDAGKSLMMAGTHTNISERKRNELAQREALAVFESSHEGIMVVSPELRITKVNPAFTSITGYTEAQVLGESPRLLASGKHDALFYRALWEEVRRNDYWRGEIWNKRQSGEVYAEMLSISVVRDARSNVQHYVGVFTDINRLKAHEAELDRAAHYDPLTGLPNRRLLLDRLQQCALQSVRSGQSSAVCMLDVDGFKAINDQHGHAVGDQLLIGLSENLHTALRTPDTLARLGGDEFVLILCEIDSTADCMRILDRVLQAASQPIDAGPAGWISVTASVGVSLCPEDSSDADTLLRHADQAMYMAKDAGKNRYHLFDPESDRRAQKHRQHLQVLGQALREHEFLLYYHPKVDLQDGSLVGMEALIRWLDPRRGLVPPSEFLPAIYGSALENRLGEWVIEAALLQVDQWQRAGLRLKVAVNVSANHLLACGFVEFVQAALARHPDVLPSLLEIEILETVALSDMAAAIRTVQACTDIGVSFALDDFGTGYSSLTYLRKLPVQTLKIDQSFVRDMLADPDDLRIVQGVIELAAVFGRQVIAEGVETLEHGAVLRHLGCRLAQGYGVARPMPASDVALWAKDWAQRRAWESLKLPLDFSQRWPELAAPALAGA